MTNTVDQFRLQLEAFGAKSRHNADRIIRKTVIDLGTHIVEKTPVGNPELWTDPESAPPGYVGGRLRANWQYALDNVPSSTLEKIDRSDRGRATAADIAVGALNARTAFGMHFIVNNLPYARRIEFDAHSTQAPAGMVGISVLKFNEFLRANINEH